MDGYLERFLEFGCEGFDLGVFIKNDTIRGTNTNIFTQTNEIYTFRDIINTLNSDIISKSLFNKFIIFIYNS